MHYSFLKTIILLFSIVVAAIFADSYFLDRKLTHVGSAAVKKPASYFFAKLESAGFFLRGFIKIRDLTAENESLKRENSNLLSQLAGYENAKEENNFLRKALNIFPRFRNEVVYANIFYFQLGPDGYDVLLSKGAEDKVNENDAVITENGVLIGRIKKSYDNFAHVLVVNDPDFSVTAKVLNFSTAGIAKGALDKGLYLDLIVQSDPIKEGDVVVSSGMDFFPPALIVGTVSHVEANETDLFKKVKIKPAMEEVKIGRVLIIRKSTN